MEVGGGAGEAEVVGKCRVNEGVGLIMGGWAETEWGWLSRGGLSVGVGLWVGFSPRSQCWPCHPARQIHAPVATSHVAPLPQSHVWAQSVPYLPAGHASSQRTPVQPRRQRHAPVIMLQTP